MSEKFVMTSFKANQSPSFWVAVACAATASVIFFLQQHYFLSVAGQCVILALFIGDYIKVSCIQKRVKKALKEVNDELARPIKEKTKSAFDQKLLLVLLGKEVGQVCDINATPLILFAMLELEKVLDAFNDLGYQTYRFEQTLTNEKVIVLIYGEVTFIPRFPTVEDDQDNQDDLEENYHC